MSGQDGWGDGGHPHSNSGRDGDTNKPAKRRASDMVESGDVPNQQQQQQQQHYADLNKRLRTEGTAHHPQQHPHHQHQHQQHPHHHPYPYQPQHQPPQHHPPQPHQPQHPRQHPQAHPHYNPTVNASSSIRPGIYGGYGLPQAHHQAPKQDPPAYTADSRKDPTPKVISIPAVPSSSRHPSTMTSGGSLENPQQKRDHSAAQSITQVQSAQSAARAAFRPTPVNPFAASTKTAKSDPDGYVAREHDPQASTPTDAFKRSAAAASAAAAAAAAATNNTLPSHPSVPLNSFAKAQNGTPAVFAFDNKVDSPDWRINNNNGSSSSMVPSSKKDADIIKAPSVSLSHADPPEKIVAEKQKDIHKHPSVVTSTIPSAPHANPAAKEDVVDKQKGEPPSASTEANVNVNIHKSTNSDIKPPKRSISVDSKTSKSVSIKTPRSSPTNDEDRQPVRSSRRLSINSDPTIKLPEIVSTILILPTLSETATLDPLAPNEVKDLAAALEIAPSGPENGWPDDWSGVLALVDKEVVNPKNATKGAGNSPGVFRQAIYTWSQKSNSTALKYFYHLFRYVYHLEDTPSMARTILANADKKDGLALELAFRRVAYDPMVLKQDGWITAKAPEPEGASGGSNRIGENVRWQGADGIVIAYIHDEELGDLWRGVWLDEGLESFDMEAEELIDSRKKWERRAKITGITKAAGTKGKDKETEEKKKLDQSQRRSHRYTVTSDFQINGVEHGIVLAASFRKGARPGVYWPARVMHASEASTIPGGKNKRSAPRQRLDLVFLAPYWNSGSGSAVAAATTGSRRAVESFSDSLNRHGESLFSSGPLFDVESVDVTEDMLKEYPYDGRDGGINIDQLRTAFRFSGLPKAAFHRFLDSHRLALALKTYAQDQLPPRSLDHASAGLFETHPMSVAAPQFPPEVLHLPYIYILSQLPVPASEQSVHDGEERNGEPVLQLNTMIEAMKPPNCWGQERSPNQNGATPPRKRSNSRVVESPYIDAGALLRKSVKDGAKPANMGHFTKDLLHLRMLMAGGTSLGLAAMFATLEKLLSSVTPSYASLTRDEKQIKARALARSWMFAKANGEDAIGGTLHTRNSPVLFEWRRLCERIFKYMMHAFSAGGYGNGVSAVLTDFRCNQHVTACGCFERTVRLPAAIKAARDLGAGTSDNIQLQTSVEKSYVETAENKVLMKAHSASYLRRMKTRCSQIQGDDIVYLTEDSEGNGGEDTKGSRGTWMAAVASVGAAIKAVDMVVEGQCVNVFCVTRPPGHHAGRNLHPMKAVSNGFCILNTAACAALHATTPLAEGGPGLRRVCVIDFDVHHGNGTQDILCSTYDPRFLYVSLHAGGAHVNGLPNSEEFDTEIHSPGGNAGKKGIYPGRCGDSSPHAGVLNIPLGPRVTSHAVGTALINQVTPAVDAFSPDLIILSAGFDAHKNDPLGLGGLSAEDFGHITDAACQMASKCCSGRLISLLEGGYGVPCCRPQKDLFLPKVSSGPAEEKPDNGKDTTSSAEQSASPQPIETNQAETTPPPPPPPKEERATKSQPQRPQPQRPQPSKLLDLGQDLPEDMEDQVPYALQRRLERCHQEGFIDCVRGHVGSLVKCNKRS